MKSISFTICLCLLTLNIHTFEASGEIATRIPLTVNVVEGCDVDRAEIEAVIEEANKIMKQCMISFELRAVNTGVAGGNPDGGITGNQEHGIVTKSMDELKNTNGGYNGMKIIYGNSLRDDGRWGQAYHASGNHWYSVPVVFMKNRPGSYRNKGNDLAHELAHSLTLMGISNVGGSFSGQTDQWGHLLNPLDSGNLMYPYNSDSAPRGNKLAPEQIAEIKKNAQRFGRNAVVTPSPEYYQAVHPKDDILWSPYGPRVLWVDNPSETYSIPLHDDLAFGYFYADSATAGMVEMVVNLAGGFLPGMPVNRDVNIYLNIDNNISTGLQTPPYQGYDRIVKAQMPGAYPNVGVIGRLEGSNGQLIQHIPLAALSPVVVAGDYEYPESGVISHFTDTVFLSFPAPPLGISAPVVPVKITYGEGTEIMLDEVVFNWNVTMPQEPAISVSWSPLRFGEPIELNGAGFTPLEPVRVCLDDELLAVLTADGGGNISEVIPYPVWADFGRYFLNAKDVTSNRGGYTILTLLPGAADIDNDRMVNLADFVILADGWLAGGID